MTSVLQKPILKTKNIEINFFTMEVKIGNRSVHLTPIEYKILILFVANPNILLTYQTIFKEVWGWSDLDKTIVNTNINRLRNKIGKEKIDTIRGQGYIMRTH